MRTLMHERAPRPPHPCKHCRCREFTPRRCSEADCVKIAGWKTWTPEKAYRAHLRWALRMLEWRKNEPHPPHSQQLPLSKGKP